jgi:hypothetical protein
VPARRRLLPQRLGDLDLARGVALARRSAGELDERERARGRSR